MALQFSHSSCPENVTIELSEQGIVDNLTQNNSKTRPWGSRRFQNDHLYTAHVPSIDGTGFPTTLVVKKFQNINPALQVDDNVKNRCKSEMILLANIGQDNIIKVLDVIERDEAIMLVYKYEVNRNLDYWLHQHDGADRLLSWPKRMELLELVTGRMSCGAGPNGLLATWARRNCNELMANHLERFKTEVDQGIPDQARYMKEMATVFTLRVDCTAEDPQKRPSMQLALKRLRRSCGHGPLRSIFTCYLM